ncbi:MAG TPA: hypothetical protein VE398_21930 [Acidobacteriota bacterium]|nr:hypothetical protein [Acidobacteriota bacterium]
MTTRIASAVRPASGTPSWRGRSPNALLLHALGLMVLLSVSWSRSGIAQVGPAEISDPQLKAAEQDFLPQMMEVNRTIRRIKFPFVFGLSRYAGLDVKEQAGADARGLEFVRFHDRLVLKLTGNYNAAFNTDLLSANQRAGRVFRDVVSPILRLFPDNFTRNDRFDAFGFEIAYHIRTHSHGFEYEGKEIFVLVMDKSDALSFSKEKGEEKRQEALNRSEIYLDGKPFGLALGARDPFDADALGRSVRKRYPADPEAEEAASGSRQELPQREQSQTAANQQAATQVSNLKAVTMDLPQQGVSVNPGKQIRSDLDTLQKKVQSQLDSLAAEGLVKHHFVEYAPPSLVSFRDQIALQLTIKNPSAFDSDGTSIYKRAARSFDLFLAPQLKAILDKVPVMPELGCLDITIINELATKSGPSSEALELIIPLVTLRRFTDLEITNQQLIDESVVLVNGVRIALNLQAVE